TENDVPDLASLNPGYVALSQILRGPGALDVLAPVADVPLPPGAEAGELVRPEINGDMHHREAVMAARLGERAPEVLGREAAMHRLDARDRAREPHIVDRDPVAGAKPLAILRDLQAGDRRHPAIVEDHDHAAQPELDAVDQDLRVHHEGAVAAERDAVARLIGERGGEQ